MYFVIFCKINQNIVKILCFIVLYLFLYCKTHILHGILQQKGPRQRDMLSCLGPEFAPCMLGLYL